MLGEPKRNRVAERREATRQEIVAAAWEVAREEGLAQLTLRDVAERVGMRAPSLYSHFLSKNAIYDAMYAEAWAECDVALEATRRAMPRAPRAALRAIARAFFEFAVADLARHQLMNQRTIPGFVPSDDAYAPAVNALEQTRRALRECGITREAHVRIYLALVGGLVDAQLANDPGGDQYSRVLDEAVDMFADHVGIPSTRRSR